LAGFKSELREINRELDLENGKKHRRRKLRIQAAFIPLKVPISSTPICGTTEDHEVVPAGGKKTSGEKKTGFIGVDSGGND